MELFAVLNELDNFQIKYKLHETAQIMYNKNNETVFQTFTFHIENYDKTKFSHFQQTVSNRDDYDGWEITCGLREHIIDLYLGGDHYYIKFEFFKV